MMVYLDGLVAISDHLLHTAMVSTIYRHSSIVEYTILLKLSWYMPVELQPMINKLSSNISVLS